MHALLLSASVSCRVRRSSFLASLLRLSHLPPFSPIVFPVRPSSTANTERTCITPHPTWSALINLARQSALEPPPSTSLPSLITLLPSGCPSVTPLVARVHLSSAITQDPPLTTFLAACARAFRYLTKSARVQLQDTLPIILQASLQHPAGFRFRPPTTPISPVTPVTPTTPTTPGRNVETSYPWLHLQG